MKWITQYEHKWASSPEENHLEVETSNFLESIKQRINPRDWGSVADSQWDEI